MKKEISPGILIGAVVAIVAILGYFAYRTFFFDPNYTPAQGAAAEKASDELKKNSSIYKRMGEQQGRVK